MVLELADGFCERHDLRLEFGDLRVLVLSFGIGLLFGGVTGNVTKGKEKP